MLMLFELIKKDAHKSVGVKGRGYSISRNDFYITALSARHEILSVFENYFYVAKKPKNPPPLTCIL